jgi:hypothetical protein
MAGLALFLTAAILVIALVLGLLLALISPFASYRYLITHGYGGQALWRYRLRETAKGELLAAVIIGVAQWSAAGFSCCSCHCHEGPR